MRRLALFAAVLAAALLSPVTALAADATIIVGANGQKTLVPANVTVDPGNTVTWQWGANSQKHHIVSDATTGLDVWDSGEMSTGSFARAFPRSGSFAYHCAIHPDVMRGTVTVTGAPVAALAAPTPSPASVGEAVTFDEGPDRRQAVVRRRLVERCGARPDPVCPRRRPDVSRLRDVHGRAPPG